MAEYWIVAVRHTGGAISHVRCREYLTSSKSLGDNQDVTRQVVINALRDGNVFKTAVAIKMPNGDPGWQTMATVIEVVINGTSYIKTVRDNTKVDNLGSLPSF